MGLKFRILLISLLLFSASVSGQQEGDLILQSKISLHFNDQPISTILDSLSKQLSYHFSYDPSLIKANRKVSTSFSEISLEKALDIILGKSFDYKVLKDQIIITASRKSVKENTKPENPEHNFILLSGKIINFEDNSPIPFASVSLWKQPTGTISNIDGDFDLKIPPEKKNDTLIFSCVGYQKYFLPIQDFEFEKNNIYLRPVSVRIKEIKVKAISVKEIIEKMIGNIDKNYPENPFLLTSFYRETLQQDGKYINVSEAIMEILKSSYRNKYKEDRTRFIKGRKNEHKPLFKWVEFKMQGGPYYITMLDVIKTRETFIDNNFINKYKYEIDKVIFYRDRPTFVISFKPLIKSNPETFEGRLYIDRETYALVQANFNLNRTGLKNARKSMIRKKPKGFNVKPEEVSYQVTYKLNNGKWFLNTARIHIIFKVRSRNDKINSLYTSISDLLITDYSQTEEKRFKSSETFRADDIFTEKIVDFDKNFWGQYNIIKPNEELINAIKKNQNRKEK